MRKNPILHLHKCLYSICIFAILPIAGIAQSGQISLNDLSAFKTPTSNWHIVGSVTGSLTQPFKTQPGQGILVNELNNGKNQDIFTNFQHGDINLDVDFMMPPESNSGIYLQGRYEIQLLDSWATDVETSQDLGSVYQRWDTTRANGDFGYQGIPPRINVSKAPGLWQNIKISFIAPKFDASGKKIANARIVKIVLNGVTIIENAELTGPTRGSAFPDEAAMGPLRLQGDHDNVAFRMIKYDTNLVANPYDANAPRSFSDADRPVYVEVKDEPVVLRSFVNFEGKTLSHVANVGYPHHISFSYDLEHGSIFQVWRGGFVDATPMWWFRGDGTTKAMGSIMPLNDGPPLAVLANEHAAIPDTLSDQQAYRPKGYELDSLGYPTFKYISCNVQVDDKVVPSDNGKTITRQVTLTGAGQNLYYRAASARDIVLLNDGMYSINNFDYYIRLSSKNKTKPILRTTATGMELLLPVKDPAKGETLAYTLIW